MSNHQKGQDLTDAPLRIGTANFEDQKLPCRFLMNSIEFLIQNIKIWDYAIRN